MNRVENIHTLSSIGNSSNLGNVLSLSPHDSVSSGSEVVVVKLLSAGSAEFLGNNLAEKALTLFNNPWFVDTFRHLETKSSVIGVV